MKQSLRQLIEETNASLAVTQKALIRNSKEIRAALKAFKKE